MRERDLTLNTQINTYSVAGQTFTDLQDLELYMTANGIETITGDIADTSISVLDFTSDSQAIREEFFSDIDDTTGIVTDSTIVGLVDGKEDTTGGGAPKGFTGA